MALEYLENIGRAKSLVELEPRTPIIGVMKDFAEMMIALSKKELEDGNPPHFATGSLSQSIAFTINFQETVSIDFLMNDYWDFINEGVNGLENQFGSPYSFKSLNPSPQMVDAFTGVGSIDGWIRAKGITQLIYTDQFGNSIVQDLITEDDFRGAGYVFARGVKRRGIEGNNFINNVFNEKALAKFEQEVFDALANVL